MAFQIVDDVLDFTGDPARLGKPVGNDLRQGVMTLPALIYLEDHPGDPDLGAIIRRESLDEPALKGLIERIRRSAAIDRSLETAAASSGRRWKTWRACPKVPSVSPWQRSPWRSSNGISDRWTEGYNSRNMNKFETLVRNYARPIPGADPGLRAAGLGSGRLDGGRSMGCTLPWCWSGRSAPTSASTPSTNTSTSSPAWTRRPGAPPSAAAAARCRPGRSWPAWRWSRPGARLRSRRSPGCTSPSCAGRHPAAGIIGTVHLLYRLHPLAGAQPVPVPDRAGVGLRAADGDERPLRPDRRLLLDGLRRLAGALLPGQRPAAAEPVPRRGSRPERGSPAHPDPLGRRTASLVYNLFLLLAYLTIVLGVVFGLLPALSLLGLLSAVLAIPAGSRAFRHADDIPGLIPALGLNVLVNLLTPVLVGVGLLIK